MVNIGDSVTSQDGALRATLTAFDPRRGEGRVKIEELKAERGRRRILAALAHSALKDPEEYVRSSAYKSLQIVNGVSREKHLELLRDQSLSVDPARVQSILTAIS
jgi:hypothetical protein